MNKIHYIHTVYYYSKQYTEDINWNEKAKYSFNRNILWYLNQNNQEYTSEWWIKTWKEYEFTCDVVNEDLKTWNYIEFEWSKYSIKNVAKHKWITFWYMKIYLIKQD